ncbi:hypothetical protein [Paraburkholderia fungorum]|uniref:hypothetical protein n=1 Tax=Paraburkholderia fungorum TaxID=134537 RepID=UPI001618A1C3|nr:hypothetical protein [Paraburkholderia fungorum]MBB5547515.1 hypothetical protein [Paraburkholderia fungorum]
MNIEMSENGMLIITPETSVEAFALRKWMQEHPPLTCCFERENGTGFVIDATWPRGQYS